MVWVVYSMFKSMIAPGGKTEFKTFVERVSRRRSLLSNENTKA